MEQYITLIQDFVRAHKEWALVLACLVGAAESVVVVSLFVPSTAIFVALAATGSLTGTDLVLAVLATGLGASLGDWVSYGLGYRYKGAIRYMWPMTKWPDLIPQSSLYFQRWGVLSIFICRFIGPARAFIMLVAGIAGMPPLYFGVASLVSAMLWAIAVLVPATYGAQWFWAS